jgi:hypothetical protein
MKNNKCPRHTCILLHALRLRPHVFAVAQMPYCCDDRLEAVALATDYPSPTAMSVCRLYVLELEADTEHDKVVSCLPWRLWRARVTLDGCLQVCHHFGQL